MTTSFIPWAVRRSWRTLAAYGAFTAWGLVCLVASVVLILGERALPVLSSSLLVTLLGVCGATLAGHLLGNAVALLRLRLWVVGVVGACVAIGLAVSDVEIGNAAGFVLVGALAAAGGWFGIASRMDIVAAWLPLSYAVGASIIWMNNHQKVSVWLTGAKFAVWDAVSFVFLTGAVLLFLVYLTSRHALALTLWQAAAKPGGDVNVLDANARAGNGSVLVIFGLTGVVLAATAVVSPFLFGTHEDPAHAYGSYGGTHAAQQWHGPSSYTTTTSKGRPRVQYGDFGHGASGSYGGGYDTYSGTDTSYGTGFGTSTGGTARFTDRGSTWTGAGSGEIRWSETGTVPNAEGYGTGANARGPDGKRLARNEARGASSRSSSASSSGVATAAADTPPPRVEEVKPPEEKQEPPKPPSDPASCDPTAPGFDPKCLLTLKAANGASDTANTAANAGPAASSSGTASSGAASTGVATSAGGMVGSTTGTGDIGGVDVAAPAPVATGPSDPTAYANLAPGVREPDMARAAEKSVDIAKIGAFLLAALVALLAMFLVLLAVFFKPLRRAIVLRHLERPLWKTPPTRRVENLWLRALVALDDVGIHQRANETPQQFAQRAREALAQKHGEAPLGVDDAARIIERVEYAGRGLSSDEEAKMRAAVTSFLSYVSKHLTTAQKVALGWADVRTR